MRVAMRVRFSSLGDLDLVHQECIYVHMSDLKLVLQGVCVRVCVGGGLE